MSSAHKTLVFVLTVSLVWLAACGSPNPAKNDGGTGPLDIQFGQEMPSDLAEVLMQAEELELFALNPDWPTEETRNDPNAFHGYLVRGQATLTDREQRLGLLASFAQGDQENDSIVAACFNPRHGLRARHGDKVCDIVICFECLSYKLHDQDGQRDGGLISRDPQPHFDQVYTGLGLSIASR